MRIILLVLCTERKQLKEGSRQWAVGVLNKPPTIDQLDSQKNCRDVTCHVSTLSE